MIELPYYAVIFTSQKKLESEGYDLAASKMDALAAQQSGFLGFHSARNQQGLGITVSYWRTLQDISNWKQNHEHRNVQGQGQKLWYESYEIRICKVERQYSFGELESNA